MKEEKKIINKLKQKTKNNQKLACGCGYYSCDRAFLMGFTTTQAPMIDEKKIIIIERNDCY